MDNYGLDMHCSMILDEYREAIPVFRKIQVIASEAIKAMVKENGIYITAFETRIKEEKSLAGKLELKGHKYSSLSDITDILGMRVITFYNDEVDKISAIVDNMFDIDWENSVDKRRMHEIDSFGYNSLHYICRIPRNMFHDPEHPEINEYRFEVQMRTALQHVWSTINHDIGYKSGLEIPKEYLRSINCLAGLLEMADNQFGQIRTSINEYRRKVESLVKGGRFEEVLLDGDSFKSYLSLNPFDKLTNKIAAVNQAEIYTTSLMPYLEVLKDIGFRTLKDIEDLIRDFSDDAYKLAVHQIGKTDIDIVASSIAIQNLIFAFILRKGKGEDGLRKMFDTLEGESDYNKIRAHRILESAEKLKLTDI